MASLSYMSQSASYGTPSHKREDPLQQFETGRIQLLQQERLHIQKKTFTKWMNSFLNKARLEVFDLFTDLADGKMLLKLLEIISGEKLGKPNNGRMRVHKVENVNKSLAFLHTKVRLESIGAEDIVDGNPRLILGLIWTIILRFHIQQIEINLDEENESSEKKSAKDALLLWCQRRTAGYRGVHIQDFCGSWRSGMGFNALIHSHRPDLVQYTDLQANSHIENLNNAFAIAHEELGIARILDAEDVDQSKPDEKSIITYVASYYHTFAKMRNEIKGSRRIANIMTQMKDVDDTKNTYEGIATNLLEWIRCKVIQLNDHTFPNSLDGIQKLLIQFKTYRTEEKPPKYMECSEIEALYFSINASLKAVNRPNYVPKDGYLIKDIEREWQKLEKAENKREIALREELLRQERLEHLAFKFEKKGLLRKGYCEEMIEVLTDTRYGSKLDQIDATLKKHEAISADIFARGERFDDLTKMSNELLVENYHGKDNVRQKELDILGKWKTLLALLDNQKVLLQLNNQLMCLLREANTIMDSIEELSGNFRSLDDGGFLMAVEDLIQKHSLMESQAKSMGDTISRFNKQSTVFIDKADALKDITLLKDKLDQLNSEHDQLLKLASLRRDKLEDARNLYLFQVDIKEEEAWVVEKQRICQAVFSAKGIRSVMSLQQKHKALQDEMNARCAKTDSIIKNGENLCQNLHPHALSIKQEIDAVQKKWKQLQVLVAERKKLLEDAVEAYSFIADANEADSWITEKIPLVSSQDFGEDELSAQARLQLNARLLAELKVYDGDIKALNQMGNKLVQRGIMSLNLTSPQQAVSDEGTDAWEYVDQMVAQEYWEELVNEQETVEFITEEKLMDMVKARYTFDGQGMAMNKGEEMFLLSKTNADWWNVRKVSGEEGFAPANYLKDIEPRLVKLKVRKSKKVPVTERVKKVRMVKQKVKKDKPKAPPRKKTPEDDETVLTRLANINGSFDRLKHLAETRTELLRDAIRLFLFYRECTDFEQWMREHEKLLKHEPTESVEAAKRKFEQFLTDMSAASKRIAVIDRMAEDLKTNEKVPLRQRQIHDQWQHLNRLKQQKERSLEGASSVELFHRTCDETRDWMVEKMEKVDTDVLGYDLKTIQALQRKHDQLERELAPIEDKVAKVEDLGNSVKTSYPHERQTVKQRQEEIQGLWQQLKGKAVQRRNRLEEAVGSEIFTNSIKNLLNWVAGVKQVLNSDEAARDVSTAEKLLENHGELGDDIRTHEDEFKEVNGLGQSLLARNLQLTDVKDKLSELAEEEQAVNRGWQEKGDWLRQCLDLQLFNREADHLDAATGSHHTFLDYTDLGTTLDDVEALLKRHDDFENTLIAQDERLRTFVEMADKLTLADHYDAHNINERKHQVLSRRQSVKDKAQDRRAQLSTSMSYQQFQADADDFDTWIVEKMKCAEDESYKDLTNLERKLQKHEAFESELRANEGQLRRLNKTGDDLIAMKHYRTDDISGTLRCLNDKWTKLFDRTQEKRKNLEQAYAQLNYNKKLDETAKNLDNVHSSLRNTDVGSDLRSCKDLLNKQTNLENEMIILEKKITEFHKTGQEMAQDGHFDARNIINQSEACKTRFDTLRIPVAARREALQEALRYHEFKFQLEVELQWINDHIPAASSETIGHTLHEAQSLQKKHLKLKDELDGHKPQIDKTLAKGSQLVQENHPQKDKVEDLCSELVGSWDNLNQAAQKRTQQLELNMKAQYYFFEANDVEAWMSEKRKILETKDFGKDEDASRRMLTKHKALELEIDTYSGLIKEVGSMADKMVKDNHPESKLIKDRQQVINQELKELHKLSSQLRQKLMDSMYRHEYLREAAELETWIGEQMQTASSEEYGHDYEHLLMLQLKFDDFKHRIESGSERFNQCEDLAIMLVSNENPYSANIERKKDSLDGAWTTLLARIHERDEKLEAAGEIHRFNRDVAEALSRIQDKYKSIPDYLGKGVNSVQSLMRKHEGFENDLVALEAQLQVLVDDSARLQEKYPGSNTEHIAQQQVTVVNNWNALQEKALQRRNELKESERLHKFLADSRDLMSWSNDLRSSMKTHEKVRDAASAQALKGEHESIKAEIEAREDVFQNVVDKGKLMIDQSHYASQEIKDRVDKVLEERSQLHSAWQNKKVYLDQLIDLQFFLRDVKQLETLCIAQEVKLSSSECGTTMEEVDVMVKKHAAFEKLVDAQQERLDLLKTHGAKLIEQNHFYSPNIKSHIEEVSDRRDGVKTGSKARKQQLEDALLYAKFSRDVSDANIWIDEKNIYLDTEKQKGESTSFEGKVKKLQKHQTFMAEIQAHQSRIEEISEKGNLLVSKKHAASAQVKEEVKDLNQSWKELVDASQIYFRGLEEAQDILEFTTQIEKIEAWIREKEMLVQAADLGNDYEHCLSLKRKLEDVDSDMRVDDARFSRLNKLADKIISQGRGDHKVVELRKEHLNNKWRGLKGSIDEYHQNLVGALEIHGLTRDMDDTLERINEKMVMLTSEDTGRDLHQVESLQRKQDNVIRDMSAIEKKIREHSERAAVFARKFPAKEVSIMHKLEEVKGHWDTLNRASVARQQLLGQSYTVHKFQVDLKELQNWVDDAVAKMVSAPLPTDTAQAKMLLQEHQETKAEIDTRKNVFSSLSKFGDKILRENSSAEEAIAQNLHKLKEMEKEVNASWSYRQRQLTQAHEMQLFLEMAESAKTWIAAKDAFLANEDLGDSITTVDTLIRKHENFEKTFEAQCGRIDELQHKGNALLADNHFDQKGIQAQLDLIVNKKDALRNAAQNRKEKLSESKSLHKFLRNIYEVDGWISEKLQVASDESYRDFTNLQAKIQKHAALEAELSANSPRISAVTQEGQDLLSEGHFAANEIESSVKRLETSWKQLLDASALKKLRLDQAYQALLFGRTMDDLDAWMDDTELTLQSEDHGKDLISVQNLMQKNALLEQSIGGRHSDIDHAHNTARDLLKGGHFMSDVIERRVAAVQKRYDSLHEPVQIRRENLSDSLLLQQLLRDIQDELQWLQEKQPHVLNQDLGSSLAQVQSMLKKHQAVEAEVQSHEPVIMSVNGRAQQLLRSGHFASAEIESRSNEILSFLSLLKDKASLRRLRLLDAIESQMFYSEASEAEVWMHDKKGLLTSQDFGKDFGSVGALNKKLENISKDLATFQATIDKLRSQSVKLLDRRHFDSDSIESRMAHVEATYTELETLRNSRAKRLLENEQLYQFVHEVDIVCEWLNDQMTIAASEDYGHDVEHVQILIHKFDSFMTALTSNSDKTKAIKTQGSILIDQEHSQSELINQKVCEVQQSWEDLKELANARQEALAGAKQVHVFDRNADETRTWIAEKNAIISSEDYGHDLETIQSLARRHQGFERDLGAVKEQVESVSQEAARLTDLFPDANEHISVKYEETFKMWHNLLEKSAQRKDKLHQAEQLQSYFDDYRDLMAWINEMLAKITSPELPKDVGGCEVVLSRHNEYRTEIEARVDSLETFSSAGRALVTQGHFMSDEIQEKIATLEGRKTTLVDCWDTRKRLYQNNLDLRMFLRDAQLIETWIDSRETMVRDHHLGDSISEAEELLRKHDDFLKMIDAQQDKLDPIKRLTLIEEQFKEQIRLEEDAKKAEATRREQERMSAIKRKEVMRITDARRREDERRRTQEIKFPISETEATQTNGDYNTVRDDQSRDELDKGTLKTAGSHTSLNSLKRDVKRAESMKTDSKKPKRTPSFTTRRRTQSFRKHKQVVNLPPVECQGHLERKQELQSGAKKATIRSWKLFYTVLCGQLLCFFKDEEDFFEQKAASSPVSIYQARVEKAGDYTKRKNVFRVITRDGAEYLFLSPSDSVLEEWVTKLTFHAQLAPSMQLLPYDNHKERDPVAMPLDNEASSSTSTPEPTVRTQKPPVHPDGPNRASIVTIKGHDNPLYVNLEHGTDQHKPPVHTRGYETHTRATLPGPVPEESPIYQNRISIVSSYDEPINENVYQNVRTPERHLRGSAKSIDEDVPPLPSSAPPAPAQPRRFGSFPAWATKGAVKPPPPPQFRYASEHHRHYPGGTTSKYPPYPSVGSVKIDSIDGIPGSRQPISELHSRALSLPQGTAPPSAQYDTDHRHSMTSGAERESSSESDMPSSMGKEKRKGSMFKFLSRRKGAPV